VIANVMPAVELLTVLPSASCTTTCTAGLIAAPPVTALGCTVKASLAGGPTIAVAVKVTAASPVTVAERLFGPTTVPSVQVTEP
jgi:hypothetical protein